MLHERIDHRIENQQVQVGPASFLRSVSGSSSRWGVLIIGLLLFIIVAVVLFSVKIPQHVVAASTKSSTLYLTARRSPTPIVYTSPLYLQFSALQGKASALHQVITIKKSSVRKLLYWRFLSTRAMNSWLTIAPASGKIIVGQYTAAITVSVVSSRLSPGRYTAQVALILTDSHNKIMLGGSLTSIVTLWVVGRR